MKLEEQKKKEYALNAALTSPASELKVYFLRPLKLH